MHFLARVVVDGATKDAFVKYCMVRSETVSMYIVVMKTSLCGFLGGFGGDAGHLSNETGAKVQTVGRWERSRILVFSVDEGVEIVGWKWGCRSIQGHSSQQAYSMLLLHFLGVMYVVSAVFAWLPEQNDKNAFDRAFRYRVQFLTGEVGIHEVFARCCPLVL